VANADAPLPGDLPTSSGHRVVLGVCGGIAAYKACELLRLFTESGHDVTVVPTAAALNFVGAATWAALSGKPVRADVWHGAHEVPHVRLGQQADLVVIAPATADLIARAATGMADDLLTNVLLTARCPIVFVPAMHTEMWQHQATQANVTTLRQRGALVVEPAVGRLTGADSGAGRLPEPAAIFALARRVLRTGRAAPVGTGGPVGTAAPVDLAGRSLDLAARRIVVSAGGTREPLDPVRFLGNRSSGRQGYALASTAVARGAEVTLVSANVALADPAGAKMVRVGTAEELRAAVLAAAGEADAVVMAAAVADFRPARIAQSKIKKSELGGSTTIELVANPDVLAEVSSARRPGQVVVGFAAETTDVLANGRTKQAAKGADLMVVNEVGPGRGFDAADNAATILVAGGTPIDVPLGPKEALADRVWDLVVALLPPATRAD
jgi:phosphopantothenoylcysteine decarboxylase / phosphopantothenate---cysteine ligase